MPAFITGAFGSTALGVFQVQEGRSATQIVGRNGRDPVTGHTINKRIYHPRLRVFRARKVTIESRHKLRNR